jgi:hypothetical protein
LAWANNITKTGWGRANERAGCVNFGADYRAPGRILLSNVATFRVGQNGDAPEGRSAKLSICLQPGRPELDRLAGAVPDAGERGGPA